MAAFSERLRTIAEYIEPGQTVADIGTDHGILPLYLAENGICPKLIMTDISGDSLEKARSAFREYEEKHGLGRSFTADFRRGDGFDTLGRGETDVVVIAGVGGVLITKILGSDMSKTLSFGKYILQPRNGSGKLRYWLMEAGFSIVSESLAEEGAFICEVIAAEPPPAAGPRPGLSGHPGDVKYEIPYACDRFASPGATAFRESRLFKSFISRKINIEKEILESMIRGNAADGKMHETEQRLEFFQGVLNDGFV